MTNEKRPAIRLRAENLTCVRGERPVFAGLSFHLDAGDALVVTGANGSGKSSLLRMLAGLIAPVAGQIVFDCSDLPSADEQDGLGEHTHYLGHRDALKTSLSVRENLEFWCDFLGDGGADAASALAETGLGDLMDLPAGFLSAGQRRRLSIARLLTVKRKVWLLDEPSSTLDDRGGAMLTSVMAAHLDAGGIIVAATHAPLDFKGGRELRLGAAAAGGHL